MVFLYRFRFQRPKWCIVFCLVFLQCYCSNFTVWAKLSPPPGSVVIDTYDDRTGEDYSLKNTLLTITSSGTLIVQNMDIDNTSDLVIEAGGVLIVEGNLTTANQMTIYSGGTLIVLGDFIHNASDNQGGFTSSNPSNVYIVGNITPEELPDNYPVLKCDTTDVLKDYTNGCNYGGEIDLMQDPVYQAICGEGFEGGEIGNDQGVCIGGTPDPFVNVVSATISGNPSGFSYRWYSTTTLSNPELDIASWTPIPEGDGLEALTYTSAVMETTWFVRQAQKGAGCVVYSNIVTVTASEKPGPIGIFFE